MQYRSTLWMVAYFNYIYKYTIAAKPLLKVSCSPFCKPRGKVTEPLDIWKSMNENV